MLLAHSTETLRLDVSPFNQGLWIHILWLNRNSRSSTGRNSHKLSAWIQTMDVMRLNGFMKVSLSTGLGYGMVAISGIVCIYYNVILGWTLYYLFMSFTTSALPWANCNNEWNTPACRDSWENSTAPGDQLTNFTRRNGTTPAEEYWQWVSPIAEQRCSIGVQIQLRGQIHF